MSKQTTPTTKKESEYVIDPDSGQGEPFRILGPRKGTAPFFREYFCGELNEEGDALMLINLLNDKTAKERDALKEKLTQLYSLFFSKVSTDGETDYYTISPEHINWKSVISTIEKNNNILSADEVYKVLLERNQQKKDLLKERDELKALLAEIKIDLDSNQVETARKRIKQVKPIFQESQLKALNAELLEALEEVTNLYRNHLPTEPDKEDQEVFTRIKEAIKKAKG